MLEALSRANFDRDLALIDRRVATGRGWRIVATEFPVLDVVFNHSTATALRLRLICSDWNELPPSIELLDLSGDYLTRKPRNTDTQFHPGAHPQTNRPFVCMRGSREYHTHPQHVGDLWANYRGQPGMDLGGILFQLWRVWRRSVG